MRGPFDALPIWSFVADLRALMRNPRNQRLLLHGGTEPVQQESLKLAELRNWLEQQVLPHARRRAGRS